MEEYKSRFTGQEIDAGVVKAGEALRPNDKVSKLQNDAGYLTEHQPLKTINDQSIIGYGNIVIEGGQGALVHDNTLKGSGTSASPVGVNTEKVALKTEIPDVSGLQEKLVSGTNIKTVNGQSILGAGGIDIGGGSVEANADLEGDETYLKSLSVGGTTYATDPDLSGKVISIMGDSISTFIDWIPNSRGQENDGHNLKHDVFYPSKGSYISNVNMTWWHKLIYKHFKARLGVNESWSGSFIGNNKDTNSATYTTSHGNDTGPDTCMASVTRITNLGANGTPDIIYFYGGTNDIAQPGTPGESLGTFNSSTDYSTVDLTTKKWTYFVDAYRTALMRMQYYYPKAKIIALLPTYCNTYYNRTKLDQWVEQMKEICDYFGVNYIDLRASGITWSNRTMTLGDGNIHPNDYGMTLIADYVKRKTYAILENDGKENTVYTITNELTSLVSSNRYIKGVSKNNSFTTTLSGSNLSVAKVYMGGLDITSTTYNASTGVVNIPSVTGNITISEGEPSVTPVSGVSLNKTTASISPSDTETLTATVLPANATNKNVTWSANNNHVTINPNGLTCVVTGASNGESIVTVTTEDGEFTASCAVSIHQIALDHIAITTPPSKTSYHPGDIFSTNGMIVTAYYDDETNEVLDANEYTYSPNGALSTGDTTITVSYTYNGVTKTATQNITIATLESIEVTTQPTITSYSLGQTFDPTGMIVTANWDDGTTSNAEGYTYSPDGALTAEDTEITITYTAGGVTKTTTQTITVTDATMVWATDWCEGDLTKLNTDSKPQYGGFSDTRNVAIFAQGPKQVVAVRFIPTQAGTIEVGSVGTANGAQRSQITTLTVTSDQIGQVTEFPLNITVPSGEIPYIQYTSDTGLFAYTGDNKASGKSFYNKLGQATVGTSNNSGLGVDFAYLDAPVPVKTPTAITITTPPTKTNYFVGESFSNNGMIVTASYEDSTTANVTDYTWSPSGALSIGDDTITISYTENGTTVTTTQSITVSPQGEVIYFENPEYQRASTGVRNLGTFWNTDWEAMSDAAGRELKAITIETATVGNLTLRGYDEPIDRTLSNSELQAAATTAENDGYDICTINLASGVNTYYLDGSDSRVTIINQAAIDVCPSTLGIFKTGDAGMFKYQNQSGLPTLDGPTFVFQGGTSYNNRQMLGFSVVVGEIPGTTTWFTDTYQFSGWTNPTSTSITTAGDFAYTGDNVKALYQGHTINIARLVPAAAGTITVRVYNDASDIIGRRDTASLRTGDTATITITQDMVSQGGYQEVPLSNALYIGPGQFWTIGTADDTGKFKFMTTASSNVPAGYSMYNYLGTTSAVIDQGATASTRAALCVDMGYKSV